MTDGDKWRELLKNAVAGLIGVACSVVIIVAVVLELDRAKTPPSQRCAHALPVGTKPATCSNLELRQCVELEERWVCTPWTKGKR